MYDMSRPDTNGKANIVYILRGIRSLGPLWVFCRPDEYTESLWTQPIHLEDCTTQGGHESAAETLPVCSWRNHAVFAEDAIVCIEGCTSTIHRTCVVPETVVSVRHAKRGSRPTVARVAYGSTEARLSSSRMYGEFTKTGWLCSNRWYWPNTGSTTHSSS